MPLLLFAAHCERTCRQGHLWPPAHRPSWWSRTPPRSAAQHGGAAVGRGHDEAKPRSRRCQRCPRGPSRFPSSAAAALGDLGTAPSSQFRGVVAWEEPDLEQRLAVLSPYLHEGAPVSAATRQVGVPSRTARRWLAMYRTVMQAWPRSERADRGGRRVPKDLVVNPRTGPWTAGPRPSRTGGLPRRL